MLRTRSYLLVLFCSLISFNLRTAFAQYGSSLGGVVTDQTGAAVSGAKVSAKNQATGVAGDSVSNGSGFYRISGLSPGRTRREAHRLLSERNVQARGQNYVVLLLPGWRIGHVNVGKGILPSQPLVHLGDSSEVKRSAKLARAVEIGEKGQPLIQHRALP
jgi:Carboxypeptidase regulatory-like domain